jgi:hypothetical protein
MRPQEWVAASVTAMDRADVLAAALTDPAHLVHLVQQVQQELTEHP